MRGLRIRLTSFLLPPLPSWIFIKYGKYKKLKHWANAGYYGSGGSIKAAIEYIEKKVKEAEKNTFTDRLKSLTEEERQVDNILKINKLGPIWSKGLRKFCYSSCEFHQ